MRISILVRWHPYTEMTPCLFPFMFNSLSHGRCGNIFSNMAFKFIIQNSSLGTTHEMALRWMPKNLSNEKSTLFQVTAWCHQAASHFLGRCWPRHLFPYGGHNKLMWICMNCHSLSILILYYTIKPPNGRIHSTKCKSPLMGSDHHDIYFSYQVKILWGMKQIIEA